MGLEPTAFSLATRRSTTELCPLIKFNYKLTFFYKQAIDKFNLACNLANFNIENNR